MRATVRRQVIKLDATRATGYKPRGVGENGGPTMRLALPVLHEDQARVYLGEGRFKAIRCGRRWGKTKLGELVAADSAIRGEFVGWFAPEYKFQAEAFNDLAEMLAPVLRRASRNDGLIRTTTGGRIDFWSLDNPNAGRSRRYHKVILDEAAFTKPTMKDIWRKSIRPTLVDYRGGALALSNTNGIDAENWFYQICNDAKLGFTNYHAPTRANPFMPEEELIELQAMTHPLVFQQEYLAEFVDFSGQAFFSQLSLLNEDGNPVLWPQICDGVFATIDTAIKDGAKHDGTAVTYWALSKHFGIPLVILDYDVIQVEGAMLETWLPTVYQRLDELAKATRARFGSLGTFIEDKVSGTILLQQAKRRGWKATPIASKLTDLGKDARAISVSGYVHRGSVKMSAEAYNRVIQYKEVTRNHLLSQVVGYRVGVDAHEDDLLDTFTYGIAIALGDNKGF
jgi:phage terminase large subunit-like protein